MYRLAEPADRTFVVSSFLASYRTAHAAGLIPMDLWDETMRPIWAAALDRPGVTTHVAAWEDDDDHVADLAGWVAVERGYLVSQKVRRFRRWCRRLVVATEPLVLYVFTKQAYRRSGVARGLFVAAGVDPRLPFLYAAKTAIVGALADQIPLARWDPMIVRYPPHSEEDGDEVRGSAAAGEILEQDLAGAE